MAPIEKGNIDLVERFAIIRRQEEKIYQCPDYLSPNFQAGLQQKAPTKSQVYHLPSDFRSCSSTTSSLFIDINEKWREVICEWIFQMIDHYDFNREIASISLNYLDRYVSTRRANRRTIQLAAMTSLFLAIKLYESTTLKMSSLIEMSHGQFNEKHISWMENSILWSLSWHVHPPTPLCFVRNFMSLLEESGCSSAAALEIKELARFLTELSVSDYYFTTRKPSSIGLGALLTAFVNIGDAMLPLYIRHNFLKHVQSIAGIDPTSEEIQECKGRLSKVFLELDI